MGLRNGFELFERSIKKKKRKKDGRKIYYSLRRDRFVLSAFIHHSEFGWRAPREK